MEVLWFKLLPLDLRLGRLFSLKYLSNVFMTAEHHGPCSLYGG